MLIDYRIVKLWRTDMEDDMAKLVALVMGDSTNEMTLENLDKFTNDVEHWLAFAGKSATEVLNYDDEDEK